MNPEVVKEVANQIRELGTSLKDLGVGGFKIYAEWYFRKSLSMGIVLLLVVPVIVWLSIFLLKTADRLRRRGKNDWDDGVFALYMFGSVIGIASVVSFVMLLFTIPQMIAPEYYALMKLLNN